jgi:hypothetical protein
VLEGPADERVDGVGERFGGHMGVWVEPVKGAHTRERHISEDVLGDQRRAEQQDHVRRDHAARQRPHRQRPRRDQDERVSRAHDQGVGLEAAAGEADVKPPEGPGEPVGPAAGARRDVHRRTRRGARGQQEGAGQHEQQAKPAERPAGRVRTADAGRLLGRDRGERRASYAGGGLYEAIVTSGRPASILRAR